ncbi:MAG: HEAT repeat domain-containing protein [Lentisphaeria bacterium]|nr:HEAT repeat domain-containing protein [Lentisphaeria bacterium]
MGPVIVRYILLFPLLQPLFRERPIEAEDIVPGPYAVVYAAERIALQRDGLRRAGWELRSVICRELRQTGYDSAVTILAEWLEQEKETRVLATVVQQLSLAENLPDGLERPLRPLLRHPSADVRYWAASLWGRLPGAAAEELLLRLGEESAEEVREAAAARLAERPGEVPAARYTICREERNPRVRASLLLALCRAPDCVGQSDAILQEAQAGPVPSRVVLAESLQGIPDVLREPLLPLLAQDPSASVRSGVADAIGALADRDQLPRLLGLAEDPDPAVRQRAVAALCALPCAESVTACVLRLGDERNLVRRESEETLVALHRTIPVGDEVAARLADPSAPVRYHVCRVLGRCGVRAYSEAIHAGLSRETLPANVAAAIEALGELGAGAAAASIAGHAGAEAAGVRAAVGAALGRLAVPSTYDALARLAFDSEESVRQAAILGIGWTRDGRVFGGVLVKVLETVADARMTATNRAAAAWAAGQLRPLQPALMARLKMQATVAVVPGMMGEMLYEREDVLCNLCLALATCAREDADAAVLFAEVHRDHSVVVPPGEPLPRVGMLVPTAELRECARQALAYREGRAVEPGERPTTEMPFSYDRLPAEDVPPPLSLRPGGASDGVFGVPAGDGRQR